MGFSPGWDFLWMGFSPECDFLKKKTCSPLVEGINGSSMEFQVSILKKRNNRKFKGIDSKIHWKSGRLTMGGTPSSK